MQEKLIYPSLLGFDLLIVQPIIKRLDSVCPGYHIDIMDGHFVPVISGEVALANLVVSESSRTHQWVHLMVDFPQSYLKSLLVWPGSIISFHFESKNEVLGVIKTIKEKKWKASVAISPKTAVDKVFPFLNILDQVLVMSVDPGAAGQSFLPEIFEKVQTLVAYRDTSKLPFRIGIDGGVNAENINKLAQLGVDDFAISSAIFKRGDPVEALEILQALLK